MSKSDKAKAAEELIKARDNIRELGRKATRADAIRVRDAEKAYKDTKDK